MGKKLKLQENKKIRQRWEGNMCTKYVRCLKKDKELLKSTIRKWTVCLKNGQKVWTDASSNKIEYRQISVRNDAANYVIRKCKLKQQNVSTYLLEWLKSNAKALTRPNANEDLKPCSLLVEVQYLGKKAIQPFWKIVG